MKLKLFFTVIIFFLCANFFAQENSPIDDFSAKSANRQTALRYLRLAKNYALQADWQKCATAAEAGNNYDKTVADLWYLMALGRYNNGMQRKFVLPLLQNSLDGAEWVDYNKSSARIFFADLLCATGRPEAALQILDQKPFIYSADAEYVRIKSYYTIGDAANVKKAREKVDVSRRIYPADPRFAHLFFAYEYRIMYTKNYAAGVFDYMPLDGAARKTADYFISRLPEYDTGDVELEIYAAIFAEGEQKTRLLKAFNARGFKSPLYAAAALEDGVIDDSYALKYFLDFMETSGEKTENRDKVSFFELERFASVLKDSAVKKNFAAYLNAYSGTLYSDTNNNLEYNLDVVYNRGRPAKILFDSDNDGCDDWVCDLDFGVPRTAHFEDKKITVYYGTYPSPVRIVFEEVPGEEGSSGSSTTIFNLANETVDAEIFKIVSDNFIEAAEISKEFFVVDESSLWIGDKIFDQDQLVVSVNSMEKPSKERDGALIRFAMLQGVPYAADYLIGEKVYAHAQFTTPLVRNIDRDGDGIFETTEIYAPLEDGVVISQADLDAATQNIWGSPVPNPARYLKMIQIDRNNDTRPDFTEEYLTHGGRISTWDLDYDGEWDSRHTIHPRMEGEALAETTEIFVLNPRNERNLVAIKSLNDEPKEILLNDDSVVVTKGASDGFYWVGMVGTATQESRACALMKGARSGVVEQFEDENFYIQSLFIDGRIFTRILEKMDLEVNENEEVENN